MRFISDVKQKMLNDIMKYLVPNSDFYQVNKHILVCRTFTFATLYHCIV